MVLPRMQYDDRLSLRHAMIDLVSVDGHVSHSEGWASRIAHESRDANQSARWRVRWRLHDCGQWGQQDITQDAALGFIC